MNDPLTPTKKFQKEINSGIASLVLLQVLADAQEPMYGYQIAKMINAGSEDGLNMKQSALYPVLRSLEKNALLESQVEPSTSGPPRRYYSITAFGREILEDWLKIWKKTTAYVTTILEGEYAA